MCICMWIGLDRNIQKLKQGENIIDFAPLTRENKGKSLIYRIEFI